MADSCWIRSKAAAAAAVSIAAIGLLAGCNSSSSSTAASSTATASAASTGATGTATPASAATTAPAPAIAFIPITEPFDPDHAAVPKSSPASCDGQSTTLAIEQCFENKTETADASIDTAQQASFVRGSAAQQTAINAADRSWLSARGTVCAKAYQTGGTIDGINTSGCLLDESTARLDALQNITPPEAVLKSTDSDSLSDLSYYTTPEGSRIALIDTQGDETGGAIIAWVIIAGSDGFAVNPAQFPYRDGSFTDAGIAAGPNPAGHKVAAGTVYQFSIDYSQLSSAPDAGKNGGWVYAPGTPVAVWR
jgi:uncharacterized protein YecT (DUF1311 family)